ncbi:MAG: hypothetical protein ACRDQW_00650 [Haloechinothrix sp.]
MALWTVAAAKAWHMAVTAFAAPLNLPRRDADAGELAAIFDAFKRLNHRNRLHGSSALSSPAVTG